MHPLNPDLAGKSPLNTAKSSPGEAESNKLLNRPSAVLSLVERLREDERRRAKLLSSVESPLVRMATELAAVPRMGDAFAGVLAAQSDAFVGIGKTMRQLMEGITKSLPDIHASVARMQSQTNALHKILEGCRFPQLDLSSNVLSEFGRGFSAGSNLNRFRLPAQVLDFPQLSAGFHEFVRASELARESLAMRLVAIPPRELFLSGDACTAIQHVDPAEEEVENERRAIREQIDEYARPTLEAALVELDEQLIGLWHGAREAATARRSDCARHVLTSLRELYTQLLHRLAPDDAVCAWSTNASDLPNGRPTRALRFRYVLRHIQSPSLTKFLELDEKGVSELFRLFNEGTHKVVSPVAPHELPFVVRRVEGFLCALIEAYHTGNQAPD